MPAQQHVDVLIVGAGISGIGTAYHLQTKCPTKSYAILERRQNLGGTWDLFKYPGIRSDSDMYTLGFSFQPWTNPKAIADGPDIMAYLHDTAREHKIDEKIQYGIAVKGASWSTSTARWTVTALDEQSGQELRYTCNFLFMCTGYYNYDHGYTPEFEGVDDFRGEVVHPQKWTDDVVYKDKRVVIIGSGATAVTLVPSLAKDAAHVTMLQRSPTYITSVPAKDKIANALRRIFPARLAYFLTRWKNVVTTMLLFNFCRRFPEAAARFLIKTVRMELGDDSDKAVQDHFTPRYRPWDQRLCLAPDGDFFAAIRAGDASVVTDQIDRFTQRGLALQSGRELEADLIVTATGLQVHFMGGMAIDVDGKPITLRDTFVYKGMMFSDIPNLTLASGYTNASWTLKVDLTAEYACRLINYMDKHGYASCCPRRTDPTAAEIPLIDLTAGYIQRALADLPKQGAHIPWRLYQNYAIDMATLRYGKIDDGEIEFSRMNAGAVTGSDAVSDTVAVAAISSSQQPSR